MREWEKLIENNTVPLTVPGTKAYFDCVVSGDSAKDAPNQLWQLYVTNV